MRAAIARGLRNVLRHLGYELIAVQASLPKAVRHDYDRILDKMGRYSFKFLDVKTFLPTTINRAYRLGLHRSPPLDILDIGTGVGYFPVVCSHYGHRVLGLDRDGNEVFQDATRWLRVNRHVFEIRAGVALPDLGRTFDLICAFMVNFDRFSERDYAPWGRDEWGYLLADLCAHHLKPAGKIVMALNPHTMRREDVLAYFRELGAKCDGNWITLERHRIYSAA